MNPSGLMSITFSGSNSGFDVFISHSWIPESGHRTHWTWLGAEPIPIEPYPRPSKIFQTRPESFQNQMVSGWLSGAAMSFVQLDQACKKDSCAKDFSWNTHSVLCDYRRSDMVNCKAASGERHMAYRKIRARVRHTCTKAIMASRSARLGCSVFATVHRGSNSICTEHRIARFQIERDRDSSLMFSLLTSNFICLFPRFCLLSCALYLEFYCQEFDSEEAFFCEGYRKWIAFALHRHKTGLQAGQPSQETFCSPQ